jgi:Recombination endonuclease VII
VPEEAQQEMKLCIKCDPPEPKPIGEFPRVGSRWGPISDICRACRRKEIANKWAKENQQQQQYEKHKDKILADTKKWAENNRERSMAIKKKSKKNHPETNLAYKKRKRIREHDKALADEYRRLLKNRYGLTPEAYEEILEKQGRKCAICRSDKPSSRGGKVRFAVDHHHETGAIRGLLCSSCNLGIGMFGENIQRLMAAVQYLSHHGLFAGGQSA